MATPTALGQMPGVRPQISGLLAACRDAYKISTEQYQSSINEGKEIINLFHNRQYTDEQLTRLEENGQPAETYNIVKMFTNAIIGYMETVVNDITIQPRHMGSASTSLLINDTVPTSLPSYSFGLTALSPLGINSIP